MRMAAALGLLAERAVALPAEAKAGIAQARAERRQKAAEQKAARSLQRLAARAEAEAKAAEAEARAARAKTAKGKAKAEAEAAEARAGNTSAAEAFGLRAISQPETIGRIIRAAQTEARAYKGIDQLEVVSFTIGRVARWAGKQTEADLKAWLEQPNKVYGRARLYAKAKAGKLSGGGGGMPANPELERQPASPNWSFWTDSQGLQLARVKASGKIELQQPVIPQPTRDWQPNTVETALSLGASVGDSLALALALLETDYSVVPMTDSQGNKLPKQARPAYGNSSVSWLSVALAYAKLTGEIVLPETARRMAERAAEAAKLSAEAEALDSRADSRREARRFAKQQKAAALEAEARAREVSQQSRAAHQSRMEARAEWRASQQTEAEALEAAKAALEAKAEWQARTARMAAAEARQKAAEAARQKAAAEAKAAQTEAFWRRMAERENRQPQQPEQSSPIRWETWAGIQTAAKPEGKPATKARARREAAAKAAAERTLLTARAIRQANSPSRIIRQTASL